MSLPLYTTGDMVVLCTDSLDMVEHNNNVFEVEYFDTETGMYFIKGQDGFSYQALESELTPHYGR